MYVIMTEQVFNRRLLIFDISDDNTFWNIFTVAEVINTMVGQLLSHVIHKQICKEYLL